MQGEGVHLREHVPILATQDVLFPNMLLPLHLRESDQLHIIDRVLNTREELGVLPQGTRSRRRTRVGPRRMGTLARVVRMERLPDRTVHIVLQGTQRFRLWELHREDPYPEGTVEPLDDAPRNPLRAEALASRVRELWDTYTRAMHDVIGINMRPVTIPDSVRHLAYFVAAGLHVDAEELYTLLELTSVEDILAYEVALLRKELWILDFMGRTQAEENERRLGPTGFLSRN